MRAANKGLARRTAPHFGRRAPHFPVRQKNSRPTTLLATQPALFRPADRRLDLRVDVLWPPHRLPQTKGVRLVRRDDLDRTDAEHAVLQPADKPRPRDL